MRVVCKGIIIVTMSVFLALAVYGCEEQDYLPPPGNQPGNPPPVAAPRYNGILVESSDEERGIVRVRVPGMDQFEGAFFDEEYYGEPRRIEVFAIPEEGFIFEGWYATNGMLISSEKTFIFSNENASWLIARFRSETDDTDETDDTITLGGVTYGTDAVKVSLDDSSIDDISALSELVNLEFLGIFGTSVSDISALSGLVELEELRLSNNSISDISALRDLVKLETLFLADNFISDISVLSGLSNLRALILSNNSIDDVSALKVLPGLRRLYLEGNPLTRQQINDLQTALPNCEIFS